MNGDPLRATIAVYDALAEAYADYWRDRSVTAAQRAYFAAHLREACPGRTPLVLDVGCGPGYDGAEMRAEGLRVVGFDLSLGMLRVGRRRYDIPLAQADMRRLPLAGGVDGIWNNCALLHLTRAAADEALREFARVLRPGGLLFLVVKEGDRSEWVERTLDQPRPRYFTYWTRERLGALLEAAGLTVRDGGAAAGDAVPWIWLLGQRNGDE